MQDMALKFRLAAAKRFRRCVLGSFEEFPEAVMYALITLRFVVYGVIFPFYLYIAGIVIMSDHGNFPVN